MILSDVLFSLLANSLLFELVSYHLGSWDTSNLLELDWFEPALRLYHLVADLGQAHSIVVERATNSSSYLAITVLGVDARLRSIVVTVETVLQSERVHDIELFPHDDSSCPQFTSLHTEST